VDFRLRWNDKKGGMAKVNVGVRTSPILRATDCESRRPSHTTAQAGILATHATASTLHLSG